MKFPILLKSSLVLIFITAIGINPVLAAPQSEMVTVKTAASKQQSQQVSSLDKLSAPSNQSTTNKEDSLTQKTTTTKKGPVKTALAATSASSGGAALANVQAASVQVEPFSGSANLAIPISTPPGRAGIQPSLALTYSSSARQLGLAGMGWTLDLGSIQRSVKKGVPSYDDSKDTFTLVEGTSQDLVKDPNSSNRYYSEVEGAFAKIEYFTDHWLITDKKGVKYYFGNTDDSRQYDPANPAHIFRWALNRVEDNNGNYMTITYTRDNGQIYPQTIAYTGNSQQSLSPYAQVTISYVPASKPSFSYISTFKVTTAQRIDHISVSVNSNNQSSYILTYKQSSDTQRDLLQSVQETGADGTTTLPPVSFNYTSGGNTFQQTTNWNIPSNLPFMTYENHPNGVEIMDMDGDAYPDLIKFNGNCGDSDPTNGVYLNNHQNGWTLNSAFPWPAGIFFVDQCNNKTINTGTPLYINDSLTKKDDDLGVRLMDIDGNGRTDIIQSFSQAAKVRPSDFDSFLSTSTSREGGTCNDQGLFNILASQRILQYQPYTVISEFGYVMSVYRQNPNQQMYLNFSGCDYTSYTSNIKTILNSDLTNSNVLGVYLNNAGQFQKNDIIFPNNVVFSIETLTQFDSATYVSHTDNLTTTKKSITFADINGDGYEDIVSTGDQSHVYLNLKSTDPTKLGWQENTQANFPNVGDFSDGSTVMVDLNGDGLPDLVRFFNGSATIYWNTGNGWQQETDPNSPWFTYQASADFRGTATLVDMNGDGLPDLVVTQSASTPFVAINTGNGWIQNNNWSIPNAALYNGSTQFLDANADGLMDYMIYTPTLSCSEKNCPPDPGSSQLWLNPGGPTPGSSDMLVHVDNGIGATTDIAYDSSAHYQNRFLPFIEQVVKSVTVSDAFGHSYTTQYSYANGYWDAAYREFQGFGTVKVIDADGNYATTTFAQDHYLKGHPLEQDSYDAAGNLYSKAVNQWQTQDIVTNGTQISKFVYLARTDNYLYDGTTTAKRTAQELTYGENPQYGDVTQTVNYGEVDANTGSDIGTDKIVSQVEYVYNTNNWLMGLPKHTLAQDYNGNTIAQTWFYYDGATDNPANGGTVPTLGRLTAKTNWLGALNQPDPKTTYTYDIYGNLQTITDPNNNTTTIVYDNTYHMFPTQTINALQQKAITTYYGVDTTPLDDGAGLHGLFAQTRSVTDANNQTAYSTYDSLGRPLISVSPKDTLALPTTQVIYNIQPTYTAITTKARVDNGSTQTIDAVEYYDGLGRLIESKSLGPNPGQYIVSGQKEYNNRGLPVKSYQPRFTTNDLNTMDPIDTTVSFNQTVYDPMARVIKTINPDGTYANISYDHWITTTIDENGHMQKSYTDAFGRLIQKEEYTGADGRASDYLTSFYTLYATTSYSYDALGNLILVMDAHNNVTTMTYDHLSRKVSMSDPDMGYWNYGYDTNGNLISQTDAKSQTVRFSYDVLNRLLNKTDGIPSGPINNFPNLSPQTPTFNVVYHYDDPNQNFGKGRLGSVSYDSGAAGFTYDQLGREIASGKTIDGVAYNVSRQYDALNRLKQLQYPDAAQVGYLYNQAGQITAVADAAAVVNGVLALNTPTINTLKSSSSWFEKNILGIEDAYAAAGVTDSILTPIPSSTLTTATVTFTWGGGSGVSSSKLLVGTGSGKSDIYSSGPISAKSATVNNIPLNGKTVYVQLYSLMGSAWKSNSYTYKTIVVPAQILTPVPGNTLTTSSVTFTWDKGGGATSYSLLIGTAVGKSDIYSSGTISAQSATATGIPLGKLIYVRLSSQINGSWYYRDYQYQTRVPGSLPPTVNITAPANNASFLAPANVTISADAADPDGSVTKVEFYNGPTLLGTAATSPYTYTWNNVSAGNYTLTAKAYDNSSNVTTSTAVVLTVNVPTPNEYIKHIDYNAAGQMIQIQYGNGVATGYTYDPLTLRLKRIYTSNAQAQKIQDLSYTYDALGQITAITDAVNTATQSFKYDALNRLIQAQGSYGTKIYVYDEIGNIIQKDGLTYRYGELNSRTDGSKAGPHAVTSLSDSTVFKYDLNGNMVSVTKMGETTTYTYDVQNRLISVSSQTSGQAAVLIAQYTYDGDGGRIKKVVYRRDKAVYNVNSSLTLFEKANQNLTATANNPTPDVTRYVGQVYEEEDPFLSSRYYNPQLGRFITPDTIVPGPGNPQNFNRYSYCNNNPVNFTDPSGHKKKHHHWWNFFSSFIGAVVGVVASFVLGPVGFGVFTTWAGAGAFGGALGGAISGGMQGGWQGALMGGLLGGVTGGIGGWGYGAMKAGNAMGGWLLGGMAAGGIGYTAATGSWDSFAGGLTGAVAGGLIGKGIVSFASSGSSQTNGASMYAGSEPAGPKKSFSITVRMVNDESTPLPQKLALIEDLRLSAEQNIHVMETINNLTAVGGLGLMLVPGGQPAGLGVLTATGLYGAGLGIGEGVLKGSFTQIGLSAGEGLIGSGVGFLALKVAQIPEVVFNAGAMRYIAEGTGRFVSSAVARASMQLRAATESLTGSAIDAASGQ
ncbi:MAG: VCBS repeat-containing protein [Candidatus Omnitrophica bacterium]|nr:VCBS repeat-containing protein [Candidatus Omnitrophota bacterium]